MSDLSSTRANPSGRTGLADEKAKTLRLRRKLLELEQRRRAGELVGKRRVESAVFSFGRLQRDTFIDIWPIRSAPQIAIALDVRAEGDVYRALQDLTREWLQATNEELDERVKSGEAAHRESAAEDAGAGVPAPRRRAGRRREGRSGDVQDRSLGT